MKSGANNLLREHMSHRADQRGNRQSWASGKAGAADGVAYSIGCATSSISREQADRRRVVSCMQTALADRNDERSSVSLGWP